MFRPISLTSRSNEQYQNLRKTVFKYYKNKLPYLKKNSSRLTKLSGFTSTTYECCRESCAAYTGADKDATECKGSSKNFRATQKGCNLPGWKTDKHVRASEPSHGVDEDEMMTMEIDKLISMEVDEVVQQMSGMQHPRNQYMPNPKSLNSWNQTLLRFRQSLPSCLGTIPTTLQHVGSFTAAEWHAMLEVRDFFFESRFSEKTGPLWFIKILYVACLWSLFYQHITDEAHHVLCILNRIWCIATKHSLSDYEIDELEQNCRKFVAEYETVYYAKDPALIKSCTINIHALLHIAECIRDNGPARCWWSFPLERYLQLVKQQARSKSHIIQSIKTALLRHEQASTLHLLECSLLGNDNPDAKDATVYPKLIDLIEFLNRTRDKYMSLSNTLRRRIGVADPSDISYWARFKLDKLTTVGSSYSQKKERQNNRCDNTVCYTEAGDGQRCCFGTVWGFLSIDNQADSSGRDLQFALIVRWKGVEADLDRQQVTFDNYNGNLDLVPTWRFLPLKPEKKGSFGNKDLFGYLLDGLTEVEWKLKKDNNDAHPNLGCDEKLDILQRLFKNTPSLQKAGVLSEDGLIANGRWQKSRLQRRNEITDNEYESSSKTRSRATGYRCYQCKSTEHRVDTCPYKEPAKEWAFQQRLKDEKGLNQPYRHPRTSPSRSSNSRPQRNDRNVRFESPRPFNVGVPIPITTSMLMKKSTKLL
ncbi:hypothetical protein K3495_g10322 [Podosphaera aphanis]|nr:hypothetical protein K3495_g10322 [Podosphaera aphanis]